MKILFMGLGQVGNSLLRLCLEKHLFSINQVYVIDADPSVCGNFEKMGGIKEHFITKHMEKPDESVPDFLSRGDYILDFVEKISNNDYCKYATEHGIHYISTCEDTYDGFEIEILQERLEQYKHMGKEYSDAATCILQFGMNPGLVSVLAKKAIRDIVYKAEDEYVVSHRKQLDELLKQGNYAKVSYMLQITSVQISDIDTTGIQIQEQEDTVYSTWNISSFLGETANRATLILGTDDNIEKWRSIIGKYDEKTGIAILNQLAVETKYKTYGPDNYFSGHLVTHEEIFSLNYYLSYHNNDKLLYRPRISFIYKPCDAAMRSSVKMIQKALGKPECLDWKGELITRDDMTSGGEAVGVYIMRKNAACWYTGYDLDLKDTPWGIPTVYQVAVGVYAAIKYCMTNPNKGVCMPEDVDEEKILDTVGELAILTSHEVNA